MQQVTLELAGAVAGRERHLVDGGRVDEDGTEAEEQHHRREQGEIPRRDAADLAGELRRQRVGGRRRRLWQGGGAHQRTFRLAMATMARMTEMIQKRTVTRDSGQPFFSK